MSATPSPLDFLRVCLERRVKVQIVDSRELIGVMEGYDEHCNLLMSGITETLTVGDPTSGPLRHTRSIALLFIRGDRVITVSPLS
jgi:U6 snRNA-associated Sm-like protein LSm3